MHVERTGLVEGFDQADILRYLRHEMGHVVNYAYRLYDQEEWVKQFGSITQPYGEDCRPRPFSRPSCATSQGGTPRSIPTRTGRRRSRCG